jgi:hypothetical protein
MPSPVKSVVQATRPVEAFKRAEYAQVDIQEFEIEVWIIVTGDTLVGSYDVLDTNIHQMVVRIEVLLDETADAQKGRQQSPFIFDV